MVREVRKSRRNFGRIRRKVAIAIVVAVGDKLVMKVGKNVEELAVVRGVLVGRAEKRWIVCQRVDIVQGLSSTILHWYNGTL